MRTERKWKRTLTPEEVIDKAIAREDWFSAFSNAVSYFEFWSFWALESYCLKENIDVEQKLKRLPVSTLTLMLYLLKLIDFDTYSKMNIVTRERNRLVHRNIPEKIPIYDGEKKTAEATQLLEDAKQCIRNVRKEIRSTQP
jgi:BMFP domain-containing protein YqiC